jgi:hypothetical protein
MDNNLEKSILQTLIWFDMFDYPLTKEELGRLLWKYHDFNTEFNRDFLKLGINFKNGFYFLAGRENIIKVRQSKIPTIDKKMKIAARAAKKMRWVPFVRAIFVANTVAAGTAKDSSDIDFFVIIKNDRLFLSRLLVTLLLTVFRLRRNKRCITDRVCLCFHVTDDALDLERIKLSDPDIYLCYWIDQLVPLYDPDNLGQIIQKENAWVKEYLPNAFQAYSLLHRWRVDDTRVANVFKSFFERVWAGQYGNFLEAQAKGAQEAKMKTNFMSIQNEKNSKVIINDKMMKFHENDRREEYKWLWEQKCEELT